MNTLTRNGITMQVTDALGVRATGPNGETAVGRLANSGGRVIIYPRIEFAFSSQRQRWIEPLCDHRYWHLDDYETGAEAERRPFDSGTFDLTPSECAALQVWYDAAQAPAPAVVATPVVRPATPAFIEPLFAIGGLNRGDGAEMPMPDAKFGQVCRRCGQAASDGAMFTTVGGGICDDCA
jgi:hypothetical protein